MPPRRCHQRTPADEARSKLLRKARNRRHYEKRKLGLTGNPLTRSTTAIPTDENRLSSVSTCSGSEVQGSNTSFGELMRSKSSMPQSVGSLPMLFPCTSTAIDASELVALNEALLAWGYMDDRVEYSRSLDRELRRARRASEEVRTTWINEMEEWLADGDRLAEELHDIASRELSSTLLSVIFNVLYMIAAVEARLFSLSR
ncbi:hypothetical protein K466DRAFT_605240 [Polyporus arcularius HHB13444]|uniref:Uncharacterized protein n=1 Tax=Polyporus arcularius HHB13444 TaxID=1314778 RepID=A0A5C3NTI7_9APHY|nr:hypothetical protein K466DRAFT_605240 [Polyporus arcularius HHB13444]